MGLKTLSDHYAENGMDAKEEIRRRAADAKLLVDTAKEFDIPVSMLYQPSNNPTDIDLALHEQDNPTPAPAKLFTPFPNAPKQ